jgi:putative membrane protein
MIMGIFIGIAKIIPGVSGAVLAISFGIYDLGIRAITHFFDNFKKNFLFLGSVGCGCILGIISFSKVINYFLNNYYLMVMLLFSGLVLGGTVELGKKIKKDKTIYIIMVLSLSLIVVLALSNVDNVYVIKNNIVDYVMYFLSGFVEALGTVIPGVSSTALLMIMGIYKMFIEMIANITSVTYFLTNISIILVFSLGLGIGIMVISLVMDYLFRNYKDKTYGFIIGISIGSVILMLIRSFNNGFNYLELVIGIILFIVGFLCSYFGKV